MKQILAHIAIVIMFCLYALAALMTAVIIFAIVLTPVLKIIRPDQVVDWLMYAEYSMTALGMAPAFILSYKKVWEMVKASGTKRNITLNLK